MLATPPTDVHMNGCAYPPPPFPVQVAKDQLGPLGKLHSQVVEALDGWRRAPDVKELFKFKARLAGLVAPWVAAEPAGPATAVRLQPAQQPTASNCKGGRAGSLR